MRRRQAVSRGKGRRAGTIAIVGAGIAGLYCGLKYEGPNRVRIFEASDHIGGRIWTEKYPEGDVNEFLAEFGPMRIEPDQQELLGALLRELNIVDARGDVATAKKSGFPPAYLVDFPPYSSPVTRGEPRYELVGEENDQRTPLDLLTLAFVRILGRLIVQLGTPPPRQAEHEERRDLDQLLERGHRALTLASASRQPDWRGPFQRWIDGLKERDLHLIRKYAEFEHDDGDRVPLWMMGFWNMLSEVLSHGALSKLRDQGTFYHLINENPNAAEWLVFWLRGFRTTEKLKGIQDGMELLTERTVGALGRKGIGIERKKELVHLAPSNDGVELRFADGEQVAATHVVLAIPKHPLRRVLAASSPHIPDEIIKAADAVFAFPMVKAFMVVRKRWWREDRANYYATSVPTRELHYWESRDPLSKKGMIMLYADRPGSTFWANYLPEIGRQDEPVWVSAVAPTSAGEPSFSMMQARRLLRKAVQYVRATGVETFSEEDIEHYGIRDWGREPYGGANHAWRPERKSWEILAAISAFRLVGDPRPAGANPNVHVCGEAYSDYHGFIEGSLRSAAHVLHCIEPAIQTTPTPWLSGCSVRGRVPAANKPD